MLWNGLTAQPDLQPEITVVHKVNQKKAVASASGERRGQDHRDIAADRIDNKTARAQ